MQVNRDHPKEEQAFYNLIFVKEGNFYSQVLPALNKVLHQAGERPLAFPRCLHHSLAVIGEEFIFLENLKVLGYKMEDRAVGLAEPHVSLVLKELARLHAASFLLQDRLPHGLLDEFTFLQIDWKEKFNLGSDWTGFVRNLLDLHTGVLEKMGGCEKVVGWIKKIYPKVDQLFDKMTTRAPPFATILHGDCWTNNLLFRYDVCR